MTTAPPRPPPVLLLSLVLSLALAGALAQSDPLPNVPWVNDAVFVLNPEMSDEFSGSELNETKWDPHGIRNPDTGCPKWNGPTFPEDPTYSLFFAGTTHPTDPSRKVLQYKLSNGKLMTKVIKRKLSFFENREYYCNATTFTCNHNDNIPCFSTDFNGNPRLNSDGSYLGVLHDKCKIEPFCLPHYEYVSRDADRTYRGHSGVHISSKATMKYGFVEARIKIARSPAVSAVWLHNDDMRDGLCRWKRKEGPGDARWECPSLIRSRRWQEIDLVEAMNSEYQKRRYHANVHAFAMYKGEYSSAKAVDNGDGEMGGGPIMVRDRLFTLKNPSFTDIDASLLTANEFHFNGGNASYLENDWADDWHTVATYWSPREIRFFFDGKEVKRIRNTLVHMPMYMDLTHALNTGWARETPTRQHLKRWSRVDYVRTWSVYTSDGKDPVSTQPLNMKMKTEFINHFGKRMGGMFNRFPNNDNQSATPSIPDPQEQLEPMPDLPSQTASTTRFRNGDYLRRLEDDPILRAVRQEHGDEYEPAGGEGNRRFMEERAEMNRWQKQIAESRPDRVDIVHTDPNGTVWTEGVIDAETSVFEHNNPNEPAAGWAMGDGTGIIDDGP